MQVTKNIISSLYFPMIIRCGAKKYHRRICHTILNQRYFPILELLYRYRYDHIRDVAKGKKTRINNTSENVVIVFSDLKVEFDRRAAHIKRLSC